MIEWSWQQTSSRSWIRRSRWRFDVSHIEAAGDSITWAWEMFSHRVAIVHFRDARSGDIRSVICARTVDFAAVQHALNSSACNGDVVLELETLDSPYRSKEDEIVAAVRHLEGL